MIAKHFTAPKPTVSIHLHVIIEKLMRIVPKCGLIGERLKNSNRAASELS
jgi:hypothetical protein